MRNKEKDAKLAEFRRASFLETGFRLFSERNIENVTLPQIAEASGYGTATLYRYYAKKPGFVVAVAAWKWDEFAKEIWDSWERKGYDSEKSAAMHFELYLDFFLDLYRNHRDFLCFNQFFNIYVRSERIDLKTLGPYQEMIGRMKDRFHNTVYMKAEEDHTIRTDEPEEKMFSKTLHLMLAAVTRYAVGLMYTESGFDAMEELEFLKNVILKEYKTD